MPTGQSPIFVWGGILALSLSVCAGYFGLNSLLTVVATVIAILTFEFGVAVLAGLLVEIPRQTQWETFIFQLRTRLRSTIPLGVLVILLAWQVGSWDVPRMNALIVMGFVFLLSMRNVALAVRIALKNGKGKGVPEIWAILQSMGRWQSGWRAIVAIGVPTITVLLWPG